MGGWWPWWACLVGVAQAQAAGGNDEYKLLAFNTQTVPKSVTEMDSYSAALWTAAWKDYETTVARLKQEKEGKYAHYGSKLNAIVSQMRDGYNRLKTLDAERLAAKQQFDQQKQYWKDEALDAASQTQALTDKYTKGYNEDLASQHKAFYRSEARGKKKLALILTLVNSIKSRAQKARNTLMRRVEHKETYYSGVIKQIEREREEDVKKLTAYDKKRQARALKIERQSLADALALQLRVQNTVDTMYQELDKAAERIVKVVQERAKMVDDADASSMNTESSSISQLERGLERSANEVSGKYTVALEQEAHALELFEEKMSLKMRQIMKNMDRAFSGIALDLDSTDTALENGLLKVDGAANKVNDAQKALALGKTNIGKVMKKYEEGVTEDKDTAKAIFDSALKQLKTDLGMRIMLQKQRAQTVGLKKLNEENKVFRERMDQMHQDEDARKEHVTTEMAAANKKGADISNRTGEYANFVKALVQNTTNARGTIDQMKSEMLEAIRNDNEGLEWEIKQRSNKIDLAAERVPTEVASIGDITDQVLKDMGPALKAKWLRDIPMAKNQIDLKIRPLDLALEDWKRKLSKWMRTNLDQIQHTTEKTGKLINTVMPALKSSGRRSAEGVLRDVQKIEDELKAGSSAAYVKAAEDEHTYTERFKTEAEKTKSGIMRGLNRNDRAVTKWAKDLATKIAERKAELQTAENAMVQNFNGSMQMSRDISMDIERSIIKFKAEIKSLQARASMLASPERDQAAELRKALNGALENVNKELETQEAEAKAAMEKYSAQVTSAAEAREHAVDTASSEASAGATQALMGVEDRYTDLFEKAFEDLRVLSVKMQGLPANESEWSKGLTAKIRETAGDAKDFEALVGKSKLEQQAAIDAKFRGIGELLEQKVHGLADSKRAVLARMAKQAKEEMERAVQQGKLTGKQLADRMKKLMGWLEGQVTHSEEQVGESLDSANNTQEFWNRVEEDAEARADSLMALVGREDAALNVRHDRDKFEATSASMESLLSDLEKEVDRATAAAKDRAEDLETSHEFHATQIESKYKREASAMNAAMGAEEDRQTDQLQRTRQNLERHETATQDLAKLMDASVKEFDQRAFQKTEALTEHSVEREKIQQRVKKFVDGLQVMSGETLYNAADVMNGMLDAGETHLDAEAEDIAAVAKELENAMGSEHFQVLQGLGRLDKRLDAMMERNEERAKEQRDVESTTASWRTAVAGAVDGLGGSLGKELERLRQQGLGFEKRVKDDAAGMSKQQQEAVDAIGNGMDATIAEDEKKLSDHEHDLDATGPNGQLAGGQDNINIDMGESDTKSMRQDQKALDAQAENAAQENAAMDAQQQQYQDQQVKKATGERSALKDNLESMVNGMSSSLMQAGDPDGPPVEDVQAALRKNHDLLARHSSLEQRLRALVGSGPAE